MRPDLFRFRRSEPKILRTERDYVALHKICGRFAIQLIESRTMPPSASRAHPAPGLLKLVFFALLPGIVFAGAFCVPADSMVIVAPYALGIFAILLIVLAIFSRRMRAAALALLVGSAVTGAVLASPLVSVGPGNSGAQAGQPVRIVSYNMYHSNTRAKEAIDWVIRQKPDFIILVEAAPAHSREVARLQKIYPHTYGCAGPGFCSTVILSRQPAEGVWPLSRGDPENRQALSAVTARFSIAGQDVPITAVHLDRPWPLGAQEEYLGLLSDAVATVGRGGIVAGDFNSAPWTFMMRRLAKAGELHLASGPAGTWPSGLAPILRLPLDQVYIGPCMTRESVRHGPALGSDHLPVVTDVIIGDCRG